MTETTDELGCVLVPLFDRQVLMPSVVVAEAVKIQRIRPAKTTPNWHLGMMPWRGRVLPVLSLEHLLAREVGKIPPPRANCALLVMNRSRPLEGLEFYVLLARGLPRMSWIRGTELEVIAESSGPAERATVRAGEEEATVPSLEHLEDLVIEHNLGVRSAAS